MAMPQLLSMHRQHQRDLVLALAHDANAQLLLENARMPMR